MSQLLHKTWSKVNGQSSMITIIGGLLLAIMLSSLGLKLGVSGYMIAVGVILVISSIFNLLLGIVLTLLMSFLVGFLSKIIDQPFGILLDLIISIQVLGVLVKVARNRDFSFAKSPISALLLLWIGYNMLQAFNPSAESFMAWVYSVRSMGVMALLYFVACYAFNDLNRIKTVFKWSFGLATVAALYGLKQEFFGFTDFEMRWLYADVERFNLIFQWSRMRIFSFYSDPTSFGIYMAYMSVFAFLLLRGSFSLYKKIIISFSGIAMLLAMAFAGSRTPVVLVPFGLFIFTIITLNKRIVALSGIVFMLGTAFMLKSTANPVIYRVQSAFNLDASGDTVDLRLRNQKKIQPFIHTHPFGGGLGSTGLWGKKFSPDSMLASFAHDSGFVRIGVEMGWIGLILYCILLFVVLRTCIFYYLRVNHPTIKLLYLGLTVVLFMLVLGNYPQESIVQLPNNIMFYIFLAAVVRLKDFDSISN